MFDRALYHRKELLAKALPDGFWAIDTETTLFDAEQYGASRKTRITPHTTGMRLVLGSVAGSGHVAVFHKHELVDFVAGLLTGGASLIFHNAAFDFHVLAEFAPSLRPELFKAVRQGRVHCTRTFEQLIRIARGAVTEQINRNTKLSDLARRYAGMNLTKGEERITFGQFEFNPDVPLPYLKYAADDALATYRVYAAQRPKALIYAKQECRYRALPDAEEKFGILAERNHVMGDIALFWLQRHPVRVDKPAASRALEKLSTEARRLEDALCSWTHRMSVKRVRKSGDIFVDTDVPWAKRNKRGEFKLSHKVLRSVLGTWAEEHGIEPERTNTGDVSLERDFWAEHIPRLTPALQDMPMLAGADGDDTARLSVWMAYTRLRLMESRYLIPLSAAEEHYPNYFNIGARTTRTSASRFPIQQTPKRRDGIRGLFIPRAGHVFIEADYRAAELTALAQVYHLLYGGSALGSAINKGEDPHEATARQLFTDHGSRGPQLGASAGEPAALRQACKAINFGLPGGMGPAKFSVFARSYGLSLSIEDARYLRNQALQADPELARYLSDSGTSEGRVRQAAKNLGIPCPNLVGRLRAWRDKSVGTVHWRAALKRLFRWARDPSGADYNIPTPPGFRPSFDLWRGPSRSPCGSVRGRASFTEAHNFPFQAAVADIGKIALFNLYASTAGYDPREAWWQPVCFIHDSIMIQVPDSVGQVSGAETLLHTHMLAAIREVCPDVQGAVDLEVKDRWGELGGVFREEKNVTS